MKNELYSDIIDEEELWIIVLYVNKIILIVVMNVNNCSI